jgi:hypothetical protein
MFVLQAKFTARCASETNFDCWDATIFGTQTVYFDHNFNGNLLIVKTLIVFKTDVSIPSLAA